jgi:hypothetical protein
MAPIYNEHQRLSRAKVVAIAQRILSSEMGIVAGARHLAALRFDVAGERDPDFIFFVGVDSETDHLPVGEVRSRWNPDALKAKDEELRSFEALVREKALEVCRSLILKFETHDA